MLQIKPRPLAFVLLPALCGLLLPSCSGGQRSAGDDPPSDLDAYRALVTTLASDAFEGRGVRTAGNQKAAALLAEAFATSGLEPAGEAGTHLSCFDHPVQTRVETLALRLGDAQVADEALGTSPFSMSGSFEGEMVFAGYGIHAPDEGYDDYADLDVTGKVLLVLRFEPRERDPNSPLNGERPSRFSSLRRKVFEAKSRGATAILFVTAPREGEDLDRKVVRLSPTEAQSSAGLPVLHLLPSVVDRWLKTVGTDLASEVKAIDAAFKSTPRALGRVEGRVTLEREQRKLCNVVGVLPGAGDLAKQSVVIGAHFDHLGYDQSGSMAPGVHAIHNGADDNASGAGALPILARRLAQSLGPDHRALIFVAFNGEEVGLAGSSHYVDAPAAPLASTNLMLNLDMIGRMKEKHLVVFGTESGSQIDSWVQAAAKEAGLDLETQGDGYGPSDQTPFYSHGVPVLHFFTGAHADYHRPSDDADRLNWEGADRVMRAVATVARQAATQTEKIVYQESKTGPTLAGDSRGYGAWLGTIPDYTAMSPGAEGGVKISGVNPTGPARAAGLEGGDIIVSMGGRTVDNLYDMTFVLRDHRPGDVIEVVVLRGDLRLTLAATLGERGARAGSSGGGPGHEEGGGGSHGKPASHGGGSPHAVPAGPPMDSKTLLYPGEERHLKDLKQLTFEGENAEAYFSPDGKHLVFQARGGDVPCDRIYTLDLRTLETEQISSGEGRTTCAYYTYPRGQAIIFASTQATSAACPPEPDHSQGYVWPITPSYEIYRRDARGRVRPLVTSPGYDAEATICFRDGRMVFTSTRDGDLDLYLFDPKKPKRAPRRLTFEPGYDGGAFFSPDCSKLVWRASRPTGETLVAYRDLLARNLVHPSKMEIFVGKADASEARQITHNGAANFAPYFLPDNRRVIFSSNTGDPKQRNFDLFVIDPEAKDPEATIERITHSPVFEAFPMFSPDGKTLVFSSNRNAKKEGDTNLFLATWID